MTESLTGSVQQKNGKYYAVISFKDSAGKRRQKWISTGLPIKNNRRNAEKYLQKAMDEYRNKTILPHDDILFSDFLEQWLELNKPSWASKTYHGYSAIVKNQISPYFREKKIQLQSLKHHHIQAYYQMKLETVKANTVMRHHAIIHHCLSYATKIDLIESNPSDKVILPKVEKFIGEFYTAEEIGALLKAAEGSPLEPPILLTAYYGLRRSEVTGIKWSAVDFERHTLTIDNKLIQITTGTGTSEVIASKTMKTDSSLRTLPLIENVEVYLKELKKQQESNRELLGNCYNNEYEDYVCVFQDGRLITPNYVTSQFPVLLQKHNLRKIRFHDLHHSCATLLLTLGFSIKEVQVWLGHNNFSTTANIYAHVDYKSKVALAEKIGNAIPPAK